MSRKQCSGFPDALILATITCALLAQISIASIVGTLTGTANAPIPSTRLIVADQATAATRTGVANEEGLFRWRHYLADFAPRCSNERFEKSNKGKAILFCFTCRRGRFQFRIGNNKIMKIAKSARASVLSAQYQNSELFPGVHINLKI
jgi:hypothetical protein